MELKSSVKWILIATAALATLVGASWATMTSYGTITGQVTLSKAIEWDLLESYSDVQTSLTNDTYYVLETTHQAETKWVKIKIENSADVSIPINLNISHNGGSDVNISIWDGNKNSTVINPIDISVTDLYVWIEHTFAPAANLGNYSFEINIAPA